MIGIPGLIFGFQAIKRKVISYETSSKGHIINTESNQSLRNEIEIKYKGKPVNDVWFYELRIENTGNTPVEKKDYESPITISFTNGKIISCMEGFKKPSNLQYKLSYSEKEVTIDPMLLNRKEIFNIIILVDQQNDCLPNVEGRISGTELKSKTQFADFLRQPVLPNSSIDIFDLIFVLLIVLITAFFILLIISKFS